MRSMGSGIWFLSGGGVGEREVVETTQTFAASWFSHASHFA